MGFGLVSFEMHRPSEMQNQGRLPFAVGCNFSFLYPGARSIHLATKSVSPERPTTCQKTLDAENNGSHFSNDADALESRSS